MRKLLYALLVVLGFGSAIMLVVGPEAIAQCNGVFPANTICGKITSSGIPGPLPQSTLTGVPGGTSGQVQYNNGGFFGGFTPSALTATSDTNVSITLGGTPSTALISAASITLGWSGQLSVVRGGTATSTHTTSGILFGNGTGAIGSNRCTMDSSSNITCTSSVSSTPQVNLTNSTSDANASVILLQKNRTAGNTSTSDIISDIQSYGFANSAQRITGRQQIIQTAAASGSNIPSKYVLSVSNNAGQLGQAWAFDNNSHISQAQTTNVSLGACGGGSPTIAGTDTYGTITAGTAMTACTVLFGANYASTPHCVVTWQVVGTSTATYALNTSGIAITQSSNSGNKINYHCFGG